MTVLHPICNKYPPSVKYRRRFLRELIKKHELTSSEPLDQLYDAMSEVLNAEESETCHKNYLLPSREYITLTENVAIISEGTTGLVTWEAALYFAEWAMENPDVFHGRTVLELGSGIGLMGIIVCKTCGPRRYTFSDGHPGVLQQLRKNILGNGLLLDSSSGSQPAAEGEAQGGGGEEADGGTKTSVATLGLDWEEVSLELISQLEAEVVIATDIVYDPEVVFCLISVLEKLLIHASEGTVRHPVMYVASTIRNPETYHLFKTELDKVAIKHQVIKGPTTKVFPYNRSIKIELLRLHHEK